MNASWRPWRPEESPLGRDLAALPLAFCLMSVSELNATLVLLLRVAEAACQEIRARVQGGLH